MLQYRLRAYEHFLTRPMPHLGRRLDPDRLRQDRLLPQAVRARREVVGRRPREDQGDLREARHPGGGAQVPGRRRCPVRQRSGLPLGQAKSCRSSASSSWAPTRPSRSTRRYSGSTSARSFRRRTTSSRRSTAAVWSGGSFVYVPKGVEVPLPLQAYFRINGENTGQFERTLIVVDEGAKVHYIEGCTAPIYATDSLQSRSSRSSPCRVPRSATRRSRTGPTTSTTSSRSAPTRTRTRTVEWIDANTGSRLTMKYPIHLPAR